MKVNGEESDDGRASDFDEANKENVPQRVGQLDNKSASDEEEVGRNEPQVKVQLVDSEAEETSASDSEDGDASSASQSGSQSEVSDGSSPSTRVSASASASQGHSTSADETDLESASGSASDSESEAESEPTSPPTHQKSMPSNKKLAQISDDFMSSIHEASLKRKQQVRKPPSKWMDESSEDEDEERVPSQTLPVMRRR